LQEIFRAPVYHWYGHSERVVIAGQGRSGDHLYFCPTYGFVEFGEPDADGLREVIGTSFHNHVMPLIRYRTGDRVRLAEDDAAERELPFPEISEVAGRDYEFVVSATGRRISLTAINMHDGTFDGTCAVQFAQMAPGVIECRYVRAMGGPPVNEELMRSGLMRKLGDDFDLRLRAVRETEKSPSGKHRWLASATKPKEEKTPQPDIHLNAITFHDAKAGEWEKLYQRPSFQLRRKVIMDLLRPSLSKPGHWLDAGCGSGYFSRELAKAGCDVTGVDAAAGMVEESCTRAEAEGMKDHTTFAVVESIERLPFADAIFDGVLCSSVVEYVPDAATALHELSRVLRPGGHALITVPNRYAISRVAERAVFNVTRRVSSTPWPRYLRHSRWHYSSDMMQKALAAQGLKVVATDYFGPAQPAWLNRNAVCGMMLAVLAVKQ
jgi:ubiquinone/menaquinone biosynthesis C-methylase UbiE